jgi:hypothetical protein
MERIILSQEISKQLGCESELDIPLGFFKIIKVQGSKFKVDGPEKSPIL